MAYDPQKARIAQQLIAQGLSPDQALAQAGVSASDFDFYAIDDVIGSPTRGAIVPAFSGPPARPNEIIVPAGSSIDDDEEDFFANATVTSQSTVVQQSNQVTGGGSTTRRVTPAVYEPNDQSRSLQTEADRLEIAKSARAAEIRAQGGSGADVIRDAEYRRLSQAQSDAELAASQAKTVVQAGTISVTRTPGPGGTESTQTPDSAYLTEGSAGVDPQVNVQQANRLSTGGELVQNRAPQSTAADPQANQGFVFDEFGELVPADSAEAQRIRAVSPDEFEIDGAGIGLTEEEIQEQDNPRNFEPDTVDFVFDEDGNLIPADSVAADEVRARVPEPPLNYSVTFEEGFDWVIVDDATGTFVETGFESAAQAEQRLDELVIEGTGASARTGGLPGDVLAAANEDAALQQATLDNARQQATIQSQRKQGNDTDWRVRLSLAPQSTYLYNAPDVAGQPGSGILAPLRRTNGVIFPYTPRITTSYQARYSNYDLTHSNYRGYFYQGSHVDDIQLEATFTAQDTAEAEYLLAVIHFFRAATKMFYGQDAQRGTPPPLVYLRGLGEFQYNLHPCVISQFNYNLPNDVDYIRARSKNTVSGDLLQRRQRDSVPTNIFTSAWQRLTAAGISKGAEPAPPPVPVLGTAESTYVPTKLDLSLILKPMQSREQVSRQFSLKQYANGDLLKGGFW